MTPRLIRKPAPFRVAAAFGSLLAFCCFAAVGLAGDQKTAADKPILRQRDRYAGSALMRADEKRARQVNATIRDWSIPGGQTIADFPEHGFLVVELRAGKVITVIDGKEEKRSGGQFWTVPAHSKMSVRVTSETAVLEVFALAVK